MNPNEASWSQWLTAAQAGDSRAYHRLLNAVAIYLQNYLRTRLQPDQIEDVVQEALLGLHQARHTWRNTDQFMPWLHGIVRYKLADYFRKSYRLHTHEVHDEAAYETFAVPATNTSIEKQDLLRALEDLSPKQRRLLTLTKIEGHTAVEAGKAMGMSATAVKVAVHRLLQQLKQKYKNRV